MELPNNTVRVLPLSLSAKSDCDEKDVVTEFSGDGSCGDNGQLFDSEHTNNCTFFTFIGSEEICTNVGDSLTKICFEFRDLC